MPSEDSSSGAPCPPIIPGNVKMDDDLEAQEIMKRESQWERVMKDFSLRRKYAKVEVLLLYWDKIDDSYLATGPEVDELAQVFRDEYKFGVKRLILNPPGKDDASLFLQHHLSGFLLEHDAVDALLIIYYAGHGNPDRPDDRDASLTLRGNTPLGRLSEKDDIAWATAHELIKDKKADFFLLFDCCFAGMLCGSDTRRPISNRNFEFLGACAANQFTKVPGPNSFTRALIETLRKLASEEDGFTTSELLTGILDYPDFPKHKQTPCPQSWTNSRGKMVLSPLKQNHASLGLPTQTPAPASAESPTDLCVCLSLDFLFDGVPNEEELMGICNGLKEMSEKKQLGARKIEWRSMHRKDMTPEFARAREIVWRWRWQMENSKNKKRRLSSISANRPALDEVNAPLTPFTLETQRDEVH